MVARLFAVEHIRRMRGGSQAQLLRCSNGELYVVKFQNNPQGARILANELLGTLLAKRMCLPVPEPAIVAVHPDLIHNTEDMVINLGRADIPCQPGLCFGSRYPSDQGSLGAVVDFLPDDSLQRVDNLSEFAGMLVFDKWTCNTDGRQTIFVRTPGDTTYRALMIDQGFCFNANEWNFPDAPRRGLYSRRIVYESVRGIDAFEPWLGRLEHELDRGVLEVAANEIPPPWYESDQSVLFQLTDRLDRRRFLARDLVWSAQAASRQSFPNWISEPALANA